MDDSLDDILEAIDAALDSGDIESALRMAAEARRDHGEDPDVLAIHGDALWDAGELRLAREAYVEAVKLLPESAELLATLGWCQFALADFAAAREAAAASNRLVENAEACALLGRLAERAGMLEEADRFCKRAHALDPDACPLPFRVGESEFRAVVGEALDRLPERFRQALEGEVAVLVEPVPAGELLAGEEPPLDPELLGLYVGVPLPERQEASDLPRLPDVIYLFQRNLEHEASDRDELVDQIRITVLHEVGHYLGFDDDELEERGYG